MMKYTALFLIEERKKKVVVVTILLYIYIYTYVLNKFPIVPAIMLSNLGSLASSYFILNTIISYVIQ
ncbi:hypothetical protein BD770DRAFT_404747 [Pilaira anomala]|nr:hypothetical protein BD770DRAFT_404747 [Pilaira anomala]